ncbi:hypothetical protein Pcinc_023225, partial [Petrolisthes cinctipes]
MSMGLHPVLVLVVLVATATLGAGVPASYDTAQVAGDPASYDTAQVESVPVTTWEPQDAPTFSVPSLGSQPQLTVVEVEEQEKDNVD